MKKLAIAATFALLTVVPASAQSSAPEFGSGNLPTYGNMNHTFGSSRADFGAYAQVNPRMRQLRSSKRMRGHIDAY